jgi:hypothetical protein
MANCSIPNSIPAIGRILTQSLRRSKNQNEFWGSFCAAFSPTKPIRSWPVGFFSAESLAPNAQRLTEAVEHCMRFLGCWAFSFWRVKGAWWSSRSSKPPSLRLAGRDRFDSYPLRLSFREAKLRPDLRRDRSFLLSRKEVTILVARTDP